jgi:hypothetical protein
LNFCIHTEEALLDCVVHVIRKDTTSDVIVNSKNDVHNAKIELKTKLALETSHRPL